MKASPVHAVGRAHSHCTRAHLDTEACTRLCVHSVQLEGNTTNQQCGCSGLGYAETELILIINSFILSFTIWKWKCYLLSHVRLFATPWTVACQAPLSVGFSREEYWSGLPFPSLEDLPDSGIKPGSPTLQADPLPSELAGKPIFYHIWIYLVFLIVFCQRRKETLAMDCNPRFQAKLHVIIAGDLRQTSVSSSVKWG